MNAANHSTIMFSYETENEFCMEFENSFLVFPDGKTIVGADGLKKYKLIMEDITEENSTQIRIHDDWIQTVLFDSLTQSLLVGDINGHVKQYKKVDQSFTMVKEYGDVGLGSVYSCAQVGLFAIFGGYDHSLVAIDIFGQRVCSVRLKSKFACTFSLQVCKGVGSEVYLSLGGEYPENSSDAFDCLDVTYLYNNHKNINDFYEKKNEAYALLEEKDEIINTLNLRIKELESSVQKHSDQNQGTSNKRPKESN